MSAAVACWNAKTGRFPSPLRSRAAAQAQDVAVGRVAAVAKALGRAYRGPAAQAFMHGYHLAVSVGVACLLAAALIAAAGFCDR